MPLIIYEEVGKNLKLLSPSSHCIRMALDHLGINAEFIGLTPGQLKNLNPKFKYAPILKDDRRIIQSEFKVASYLERNFPSAPTLFVGEERTQMAELLNSYVLDNLYSPLLCFLFDDLMYNLEERDRILFLSKKVFRKKSKKENLLEFNKKLNPLRSTLKKQEFLFGEIPGYVDYMVYALFVWAETLTDFPLLSPKDPLIYWKNSLHEIFNKRVA